ncbi:MAG: hypothetical protein QXH37_08310 [Candidatus Bathyarchaeia archaeon]
MKRLSPELKLELPKNFDNFSEEDVIHVNEEARVISRYRTLTLLGIFGSGEFQLVGKQAFDARLIIDAPYPVCFFPVPHYAKLAIGVKYGKPIELKLPCHLGCGRTYTYHQFFIMLPKIPTINFGCVYLTPEFLQNPKLPNFKEHIPEEETARMTYFVYALPERREEVKTWIFKNIQKIVSLFEEIKKEYNQPNLAYCFYQNPKLAAWRDYQREAAMLLSELSMIAGKGFFSSFLRSGGGKILKDVGIAF